MGEEGRGDEGPTVRQRDIVPAMDLTSPLPQPWSRPATEVADALRVRQGQGLGEAEAARRLEVAGPNRLRESRRVSAWTILRRQVQSLVTLLLVAATVASFVFREWAEG